MKEQIKIYLSTCNKTSHILSATIFLYKKFITDLKPKFKILGFNKPVPKITTIKPIKKVVSLGIAKIICPIIMIIAPYQTAF